MFNVAEALALGTRHHQAGHLAEAERVYRQVLSAEPDHPQALHNLGALALQAGHLPIAIELIGRAIRQDRSQAAFHANLGEALRRTGNLTEAIRCYRLAIALEPGVAQIHAMLGATLHALGDLDDAAAALRESLRLAPEAAQPRIQLGRVLQAQGKLTEAEACFRRVLRGNELTVDANFHLGVLLQSQDNLGDAADCYRSALRLDPRNVSATFNLATLLQRQGRLDDAIAAYEETVHLDPVNFSAHNNLAMALRDQQRFQEAIAHCRAAIELNPTFSELHRNLAGCYRAAGEIDQAVVAAQRALALQPDSARAHNDLASFLHVRGQIEEALPHFLRAAELAPDDAFLHANLVHALNYAPHADAQTIYDEHVRWGARHADLLAPVTRPAVDCTPGRRLRVGYVSAFFREHAIAVFAEPIVASHDREQFEVVCYSDVNHPDAATARFRAAAESWVDTTAMSDTALAEQIAADAIDILVDLTGHLGVNRLLAFARRPAPLQVTYLGYQNTTGMQAIDYRLTDDWSDPPDATDRFHTEKLVRLPRTFFCYRPSDDAPPVNDLPALASGRVTFGSFNKLAKITAEVLSTWAQVLARTPDSRLLVLSEPSNDAVERVRKEFAVHGVVSERVEFVGKRPRAEYLQLHQRVDVALDPFPFNGHTTVCEALWMGVPVMLLAGETYVTRFGGSALINLDLQQLIARSPEEYIEIAVELAGDLDRLQRLRATLRDRMKASPLLDANGFTRNLEAAYRQMWTRWCIEQTA
jgi:protein O-GlcNAc transferase